MSSRPAPVRSPLRLPPNQKLVTNAPLFAELPRTAERLSGKTGVSQAIYRPFSRPRSAWV